MSFLSNLGNMGEMMKQAREMGRQVKEMRERLKHESFSAEVAGGLVSATVNGEGELLKIEIDDAAVEPGEKAMLEDLVTAAVNQAIRKSREAVKEQMSALTGGIDLSGMLGMS